jgi:hypothetical protein
MKLLLIILFSIAHHTLGVPSGSNFSIFLNLQNEIKKLSTWAELKIVLTEYVLHILSALNCTFQFRLSPFFKKALFVIFPRYLAMQKIEETEKAQLQY